MNKKSLALAVSALTLAIAGANLQAQPAAVQAPPDVRMEHDLLGEKAVPASALYGVQTARAMENFQISGTTLADYPELINGFAQVKMADIPEVPTNVSNMLSGRLAGVTVGGGVGNAGSGWSDAGVDLVHFGPFVFGRHIHP